MRARNLAKLRAGIQARLHPSALRVRFFAGTPDYPEWAYIETAGGYYVCEVTRCSDESQRRFRQRARSVLAALSRSRALLTTEPGKASS